MSTRSLIARLMDSRLLVGLFCVSISPLVCAQAEEAEEDLDVTMEVLPDPDAKQPNEILQRIPLPKPKRDPAPGAPAQKKDANDKSKEPDGPKRDNPDKGDIHDERGDKDRDRDGPEGAKEQAKEAHDQRNEARREENRREREPPKPPKEHPGRPGH